MFSLLAICGDGGNLEVDYSVTHEELMVHVLSACRVSLCLCAFELVSSILGIYDYRPVDDYFPFAETQILASSVRIAAIKSPTSKASSVTTICIMDTCDMYQGYLVILGDAKGYIGVLYDYSEQPSYTSLWELAWRRGCTITPPKDRRVYRLQLSFAVPFELSLGCRRTRGSRDVGFICFGSTVADNDRHVRKHQNHVYAEVIWNEGAGTSAMDTCNGYTGSRGNQIYCSI
jgi:hypothetical protein